MNDHYAESNRTKYHEIIEKLIKEQKRDGVDVEESCRRTKTANKYIKKINWWSNKYTEQF